MKIYKYKKISTSKGSRITLKSMRLIRLRSFRKSGTLY